VKNSYFKLLIYFALALSIFSLYCALVIGLGVDERYHHKNGALRYLYLSKLGNFDAYDWLNNKYYPGLYDTIHYFFLKLFDFFIDIKHVVKIKHFVNYIFSILGIVGLFFVNRKIFNKEIAILACILTLLNPIFFGHIGMNPKDPIIFFALIWVIYFFINYLENLEGSRIKYLIFMSLFIGFGTGNRLTFIALLIPLIIIWAYIIFQKKTKYLNIIIDLSLGSFLVVLLTIIAWPHVLEGNYALVFGVIKKSSNWLIPFVHGVINGNYYQIQETPRTYIFDIFLYRVPLYFSLLIIFSYIIIFLKKNFFLEKINIEFTKFFYLLNIILFFPILMMIFSKTNLYDNARLFLFTIPFFATIASFGLFFIINNFKESNYFYKPFSFVVLFFLFLFIYRFISLTPYQYVYTNYLSSPIFSKSQNKFEHDYWYASYGELIQKIKDKYGEVEASKLKIRTCDTNMKSYKFYFDRILKTNQAIPEDAEYVIMTNRVLRYRKMNCMQLFEGENIVSVERLGLTLSALRKIQSNEAKEYMTREWRIKKGELNN
jgi:hypothetical protein|tara:strand:+ start:270 stop:1901 length:1632 start_codon:yes stop_codon:yes gene_type:complete